MNGGSPTDMLILTGLLLVAGVGFVVNGIRASVAEQRCRDLLSILKEAKRRLAEENPIRTPAPCPHARTVDVTTRRGILVARLCLDCDAQLEPKR